MNKNTAAAKVFADRLTDIKSKLSAADSTDFNNLKREFNEIQAEAKQMGLTGSKAAQEMKSQLSIRLGLLTLMLAKIKKQLKSTISCLSMCVSILRKP